MSTRAQLLTAVQTDFPTNNAREITAEVLRDFLDDYIDSVWIPSTDGTPLVNPLTTLGDMIYGGAAGATTRLAGNTTTTLQVLTQTGTGVVSAAPVWVSTNGTGNILRSAGTAAIASGKTLTVSNTLTLAGTDGTTMTFPTTSATVARTDAGQTFTGTQVFTSAPTITTGAIGPGLTISTLNAGNLDSTLRLQNLGTTANTASGLEFITNNSSSSTRTAAGIYGQMTTTTAGSEVGIMILATRHAGIASGSNAMVIGDTGAISFGAGTMSFGTATTITGGAGNMTITAGTGNSRTMALQTTTSGGVATTFLTGNADQSATFANVIGVGGSSDSRRAIYVAGTNITSGGTSQSGIWSDLTFGSSVTNVGRSIYAHVNTQATSFTMGTAIGVHIDTPTIGAGSSITTNYGLLVESMTGGGTNYSIYTNSGLVRLGDTTEATTGGAGSLTTAGGIYAAKKIVSATTIQSATNVSVVSSGDAYLNADRAATSNAAAIKLFTNGTQNWFIGSGATGTNTDIEFYNYAGSLVALKLANTTGAATFGAPAVFKNYTVGTLPTASSYTYGIVFVSDATNAAGANIGTAPTGGGSVKRAVYSDGTNWLLL